ncbi:hypothetical protein TTHERM_000129897 (macronuclear) [Tetrahymena thermophila SB210]|uniref:Uncharacterized protein n=1 Tax=Tetrahymena thermophila (strain SB210) TaxID=312017 RepID=W7XI43_TETTS|nr:hypothetical protein TTHERM_000129897 [Tetrahymena thermophila SB210]EWS74301.1 hypothetical protein TTHERM_000129897 [Tetrahymena thermophila SB210]|eukprot:XP_012653122.1 hypothetical protein TTHERM_000129897 [Tetrahymena thermophila SB210]
MKKYFKKRDKVKIRTHIQMTKKITLPLNQKQVFQPKDIFDTTAVQNQMNNKIILEVENKWRIYIELKDLGQPYLETINQDSILKKRTTYNYQNFCYGKTRGKLIIKYVQ